MQTQMPGQMPYQQAQAMAYVGVGPRFLAILVDSIIIGIIVGIINAVGIGGSGVNAGHLAVSGGIDGIQRLGDILGHTVVVKARG